MRQEHHIEETTFLHFFCFPLLYPDYFSAFSYQERLSGQRLNSLCIFLPIPSLECCHQITEEDWDLLVTRFALQLPPFYSSSLLPFWTCSLKGSLQVELVDSGYKRVDRLGIFCSLPGRPTCSQSNTPIFWSLLALFFMAPFLPQLFILQWIEY